MVEDTFVRITEFHTSNSSRALLITPIDFLALSERDPERWPALETVLHRALANEEQRVWEEVETYAKLMYGRMDQLEFKSAYQDIIALCRQRGGGG